MKRSLCFLKLFSRLYPKHGLEARATMRVTTEQVQPRSSFELHHSDFVIWHSRSAFTLIEIMLAVLLMALLVSAAAFSFSKPLAIARSQDAIEMIRSFDEAGRQIARRTGLPLSLTFDLTTSKISRQEGDRTPYHGSLPHGCRIRQMRTAARRESDGEISIPCSALGASRSYAVRLTGDGFDRWLLVAGLSGEMTAVQDEAQLDSIFAATATRDEARNATDAPGHDAD